MKVAFYTLGCKVNQYETQVMADAFVKKGYQIVEHTENADVYIVNSCTVTGFGDKKSQKMLRHFKTMNKGAIIALVGCFAQAFPEKVSQIENVDVIMGSFNKLDIVKNIEEFIINKNKIIDIKLPSKTFEKMQSTGYQGRTRAYMKIEDGCDKWCTYCIIPKARGPIRSKALEDVKAEAKLLAKKGYKEIVLVGIDLNSYGKDIGLRITDAILAVNAVAGIKRIRLGSLEPELLTDEDIAILSKLEKFCPQFHLSLQSGCDETLKRMNRHYDTATYMQIVEKIRKNFDNPSITTDVMVGFPGETNEEFVKSLDFVKNLSLAKGHVFPYSIRKGTKAAVMPNQIPKSIKEERVKQMSQFCEGEEFLKTQIGTICEVLFESKLDDNIYIGHTKNYTKAKYKSMSDVRGEILRLKIIDVKDEYCIVERNV